MNAENVISLPASVTTLLPHRRVKMTSTGLAYCQPGDACTGTLQPNDLDRSVGAVLRTFAGIHHVTLGDATAIAVGDALEAAADGQVVKHTAGKIVGYATQPCATQGCYFEAVFIESGDNTNPVIAAGIHAWAGGAATTDSIAVVGLLVTDVVIATLAARGAAETLILAANDGGNDQIDLTLSANGTDGTTKVHFLVIRPTA